jgi:formate-dependent phosphoribosylglycinamide formyltransferase (GAR transformylase)
VPDPPLAGRRLLCLGAGIEQEPFLRWAARLGAETVALDRDPSAPGLRVADIPKQVDPGDLDAVLALVEKIRPHALLPVPMGRLLAVAGTLNDALGLPGVTANAAMLSTDKVAMRRALETVDVVQPAFSVARTPRDLASAVHEMGPRLVVKPRHGSGSRGVVVVDALDSVDDLLAEHLAARGDDESLVERFVEGEEVGVDGVFVADHPVLLAVREKELTPLPHRQEQGYATPWRNGAWDDEIAHVLRAIGAALGLRDCAVNADVIVTDSGAVTLVELTARPAGLFIFSTLLPAVLSETLMDEVLVRLVAPDRASDRPPRMPAPASAVLRFPPFPPGRVVSVAQPDVAGEGIVVARTDLEPGDVIGPVAAAHDALERGLVITVGETLESARQRADEAVAALGVDVDTVSAR